ncbi:hypothetical protein AKO1_003456 [Acrasis kona]|uniref:ARMET C-terminal domain-containing protein n=1 Tax=Acrasis kona TaxID=1008807 RepID=A0AAW2Z7F3_9EUKA
MKSVTLLALFILSVLITLSLQQEAQTEPTEINKEAPDIVHAENPDVKKFLDNKYDRVRLKKLKSLELKRLLEEKGLSSEGYSEKSDLIDKIIESKDLPNVPVPEKLKPVFDAPRKPDGSPGEMNYDEIMKFMMEKNKQDKEKNEELFAKLREHGFDTSTLEKKSQEDDLFARAAEIRRKNEEEKAKQAKEEKNDEL